MNAPASLTATERADRRYVGLDTWPPDTVLEALLHGQRRAIDAVEPAIPAIAKAAGRAADAIRHGGRLVYLGCGSPALIALGDALEIPQTYGVPREKIVLIFAGGEAITRNLTGVDEDNSEQAVADVAAAGIGAGDCVVAISASGSTPYTVAGLTAAREAGASTVGIAGNAGSALLKAAEIEVLLDTGPEVISGSTRLGAGTAQKAALNMLSTLTGVLLGHVYDGLMVNVTADNGKLRARAARIVAQITGTELDSAQRALAATQGVVKPAILIAAGAGSRDAAEKLLRVADGNVRKALAHAGFERS